MVLEDEELRSLKAETSKQMEIVEFVRMDEIDPIYLETSYYVTPDEVGERPYTLLFEAMRARGLRGPRAIGDAQPRAHRHPPPWPDRAHRPHDVLFRRSRRTEEFRAETTDLNPRELELAKRLIGSMVAPFDPEKFRDSYRQRVQEMIDAKLAGHEVARAAAPKRAPAVIDIMQALQESLKAVKKPVSEASAPTRPAKQRKRKAS